MLSLLSPFYLCPKNLICHSSGRRNTTKRSSSSSSSSSLPALNFLYFFLGTMREFGSEPTSSSPSVKRSRDPEDEVYLDNFHSQKRYLSEIMASSLNGLTVEDSLSANVMESPARSEPMCYLRDEISWQYSPMSEDSDDARCGETLANTPMVQSDSIPTSPVSPHRYHKSLSCFSSTTSTNTSYPLPGCNLASVSCSQPRQRGSDSEGRFPSSPSDICHSADLRRAALLRSVQMRTQPLVIPSYDMPFTSEQEPMQNIEADEHSCLCVKSLANGCECQTSERVSNLFIEDCSSMRMSPDSRLSREKSCSVMNMNMNMKEEAGVQLCRQNLEGSCVSVSSRRSLLSGKSKDSVDSNN